MSAGELTVGPNVWLLPSKDGDDPMSAYLTRDDAEAERDESYELEPVEYVPAARLLSEARDAIVLRVVDEADPLLTCLVCHGDNCERTVLFQTDSRGSRKGVAAGLHDKCHVRAAPGRPQDPSLAFDRAAMAARAHEYRDILVAVVEALHNGSFAGEHTSDAMLRDVPREVDGYCAMLRKERSVLERKLAVLTEALLFYADDRNWLVTVADGRRAALAKRSDFQYGAAHEEGGATARAALASAAALSERSSVRPSPPEVAEGAPVR
jgi:hypothetical protein